MNTSADHFEDRLLAELKTIVDANPEPARRGAAERKLRRPVAVGGVLAGLGVGVTTAAVLLTGGTGAAYAVESSPNGNVTVTIKSVKDAPGLQQKLNAAGIKAVVDYLPQGKTCDPSRVRPGGGPGTKVLSSIKTLPSGSATFTISKSALSGDQTLVVASSGDKPSMVAIQIASGPVGACHAIAISTVPGGAPLPPGAKVQTRTGPDKGQSLQGG